MKKNKITTIFELLEEGKKRKLKDNDIPCPDDNPQRLCMDELQRRIWDLPDRDDHFRGGAWSGD